MDRRKLARMLWLARRKAQRAEEAARARRLDAQRRARQRRLRTRSATLLALLAAAERRRVDRAQGGWQGSTLNGYLEKGDEITYRQNFRVTRNTLRYITERLSSAGYVKDNQCRNKALRVTALFKVAVCMYYLAHGSCATKVVGDVASLGASTVDLYLSQFCKGVLAVLKPIYMPGTPPSELRLQRIRMEFAKRRGIGQVGLAVDSTHLPYNGGPDYRNYKGWPSILAVAFVDSFFLLV
jgi:hypothetical protein